MRIRPDEQEVGSILEAFVSQTHVINKMGNNPLKTQRPATTVRSGRVQDLGPSQSKDKLLYLTPSKPRL